MSLGFDLKTVSALSAQALASYLRSRGWSHDRAYGDFGAIFQKTTESGAKNELLMSTAHRASDFARVNAILLDELAELESRSPADLVQDLATATFDVIRVRSPDADDIGSIALSVGVEIHEQARDLIFAIANAAAAPQPRASWRGRRYEKANEYLSALRLGQSQKGSFVITLLSPWDFTPADDAVGTQLLTANPFGRQVTRLLARALSSTRRALDRAPAEGIETAFSNVIKDGVSSNFCAALARLAQEADGVDLSIKWAATNLEPDTPSMALRRDDAQALLDAGRFLVRTSPIADYTLEGIVYQVTSDLENWDGVAVLLAKVDGALRRVRVTFSSDDRQEVYEAANSKSFVEVTGDLKASGRSLELLNPRGFRVLGVESETEPSAGIFG